MRKYNIYTTNQHGKIVLQNIVVGDESYSEVSGSGEMVIRDRVGVIAVVPKSMLVIRGGQEDRPVVMYPLSDFQIYTVNGNKVEYVQTYQATGRQELENGVTVLYLNDIDTYVCDPNTIVIRCPLGSPILVKTNSA